MNRIVWILVLAALTACERGAETAPPPATEPAPRATEPAPLALDRAALSARAKAVFGELPTEAPNPANPSTAAAQRQ